MTFVFTVVLTCMAMVALSACAQQGSSASTTTSTASAGADTAQFATLGDVFAEDPESMESTFDEQRYACAFNWGGAWWHVEAALEDGMFDEIDAVWVEDQDKVKELLSPLAVTKCDALTDALDTDTLASYNGKTGADLTADGFEFSTGTLVVNGDETDCVAAKGNFDYLVTFNGKVADENTDDPAGAVADLTVSNMEIQGVSWNVLEG